MCGGGEGIIVCDGGDIIVCDGEGIIVSDGGGGSIIVSVCFLFMVIFLFCFQFVGAERTNL